MLATQQVWEKYDMEVLNKGGWLGGFDSQQAAVINLPKASRYLRKLQRLKNKTSITPQSPLRRINLINKTNQT
jgi:hypothetical protein